MHIRQDKLMRLVAVLAGPVLLGPLIILALVAHAGARHTGRSRKPRPAANLIPNASLAAGGDGRPAGWKADSWGVNTSDFAWSPASRSGQGSLRAAITAYRTGAAKWYFTPIAALRPGATYLFSLRYRASAQPAVTAVYHMRGGATRYEQAATPLMAANAAAAWQRYQTAVTPPPGAVSASIAVSISSVGWLETTGYRLAASPPVGFARALVSLDFDDGWQSVYANGLPLLRRYGLVSTEFIVSGKIGAPGRMTAPQIRAFQQQGSEIASHTVDHLNLAKVSPSQLHYQLGQAQATLRRLFGRSAATDFASPYGAYNARVIAAIKADYASHRSIDAGYNSKNGFNRYDIKVQNILSTTPPSQVAYWVRHAIATRTWLVIVYHQVQNSIPPSEAYAVTTANLNEELAGIKASGVKVVTMRQALSLIAPQL